MSEKTHPYTPDDASQLLESLLEGDDFLKRIQTRERKNPWGEWIRASREIGRQHATERRQLEGASFRPSPARDLFPFLSNTRGALPSLMDPAKVKKRLEKLITRNDAAFAEIQDPELKGAFVDTAAAEERQIVDAYAQNLVSQRRRATVRELEERNYGYGKDAHLKNIKDAQKAAWADSRYYGKDLSHENLDLHDVRILLERVSDSKRTRALILLDEATAAKREALETPSAAEIKRQNFKMTEEEEVTLGHVLDQCVGFFAQLHQIPSHHAQYLAPDDLTVHDYQLALAAAPKALRGVSFPALVALMRGQLLKTLSDVEEIDILDDNQEGYSGSYTILSRALRNQLRGIQDRRIMVPSTDGHKGGKRKSCIRRTFQSDRSNFEVQKFNWEGSLFYEAEINPGALLHIQGAKLIACKGNLAQQRFTNSAVAYFNGALTRCHITRGQLHFMEGTLRHCELSGVDLEVSDGFKMEGGYVHSGKLTCHEGGLFNSVVFQGTTLDLSGISGSGEPLFESCDFTGIKIGSKDLRTLARRSRDCSFGSKDLKKIKKEGIKVGAANGDEQWEEIDGIISDDEGNLVQDWRKLIHFPYEIPALSADMIDPERSALKGVPPSPALSSGVRGMDPRVWARPLAGQNILKLHQRETTYRKLVRFVEDNPSARTISLTNWMQLLKEIGETELQEHLGLPPSLLRYPPEHLDEMPDRKIWYGENRNSLQLTYHSKSDGLSRSAYSRPTPQLSYGDKQLTPYSKLQYLREILVRTMAALHEFGLHIKELLDQGYVFPTLNPDIEGITFAGLVHPDVDNELNGRAVRNDIEIPGNQRGTIVNISSEDNNDGKSTLQAAIALGVLQMQCGLPVPAKKSEINPEAAFDHIIVMPNTRADAGQGDGVMKERAKRYIELRDRLKAIAVSSNPPHVLVLMDEVSMGATNHKDATKFDIRTVREVTERIEGINPVVLAIVQDADEIVPEWIDAVGDERVVCLAHLPDTRPHFFQVTDQIVTSKPTTVLTDLGIDYLLDDAQWETGK
jgi:hypothetical protein